MRLIYSRSLHRLTVIPRCGRISQWVAYNNATRRSKGVWPLGTFKATVLISVEGKSGERDGSFGKWLLKFSVPDRTGMGIHAGREDVPDALGRRGAAHATLGCIRVFHDAMEEIARVFKLDKQTTLEVTA